MDEPNKVTKKEPQNFIPTVQVKYVQMQQLNLVVDIEWSTLLVTKPKEPNVMTAHEFVVGASILTWKWQDCVEHYDHFREQVLIIVSDLGPSFAEVQGTSQQVDSG
jgi:hypothetical protein